MQKKIVLTIFILFMSLAVHAQEWKFFQGAKILSIVQWEGNNSVLIEVAPNIYCSVDPQDKANIALVMTLYSSGRKADFHCFPAAVTTGGIEGYPVHRIVAR